MGSSHLKNKYCSHIGFAYIAAFIVCIACFGFMLTNFSLTIDEETWILSSGNLKTWLWQGRYTLYLLAVLFNDGGSFAPFLWDFLGIILWFLSGMVFVHVFLGEKKNEHPGTVFFMLAYYSSVPFVLANLFAFSMQSLQNGLAALLTAFAVLLTEKYIEERGKKKLAGIVVLLIISLGVYQAFICLYITAIAGISLFVQTDNKKGSSKKILLAGAAICVIAAFSYWLINKAAGYAVGTQGYLSANYVGWTSESPIKSFLMSIANIGRVSFAIPYQGVYVDGGFGIRIITALFVIYAVIKTCLAKGLRRKLSLFFSCVLLCCAPFSLYILLATYKTQGRMMLALPLAGALEIYLIYSFFRNKEAAMIKWAGIILTAIILFVNAKDMNRLFYRTDISYRQDCRTGEDIISDITHAGIDYHSKPIAFVGMIEQDGLRIRTADVLGASFFSWDDGNNVRMTDFLQTLGYQVTCADNSRMEKALDYLKENEMHAWPENGSIAELDDCIVVYLSEPTDKWYVTNNMTDWLLNNR